MSNASKAFENNLLASGPVRSVRQSAGATRPTGSLSSADILQGRTAVEINHNGATYRLQATRLGKLILTK